DSATRSCTRSPLSRGGCIGSSSAHQTGMSSTSSTTRTELARRAQPRLLWCDQGVRDTEVLIIGGGLSGIGAAIRLQQKGVPDFVLLEKADDIGGTWRDNTYPGCACDVPSALYSYSFAPKPDWTRAFAGQREIRIYLSEVAQRFGVMEHVQRRT